MRRFVLVASLLGLFGFGLASCHAPEQRYFKVKCDLVGSRSHDPIGQPGVSPSAHLHDFFGSEFTETTVTADTLRSYPTTCDNEGDTAGYWSPALFLDGVQQESFEIAAYYFGHASEHTQYYPDGLRMVAGNPNATSPQDPDVTKWACNNHPSGGDAPFDCLGEQVNLTVRFPPCWNGTDLDSADHRSHMAYMTASETCPASHPRRVPELVMHTHFLTSGDPDLTLACGSVWCGHADFLNAWDQVELDTLTTTCLNSEDGDHPECQVA